MRQSSGVTKRLKRDNDTVQLGQDFKGSLGIEFAFGSDANGHYLYLMDWQQIAALGIVGLTAALFIRARLRRRKAGLPCGSSCGLSASKNPPPSVTYHTRKGERPEIIVKMK